MAYAYDNFTRLEPHDMPRTASEAKAMGRVKAQITGGVNHYNFRDQYTPEAVEILEKLIGIVLKEHWDKSDIMTDYFNCAFYPHFAIGTWSEPYRNVKAEAMAQAA